MASFNRVILVGNLTRDPEIRYAPSGTAVSDLRMAISRKFKTADGQAKEDTCFVTVTVWGRQAEICEKYLKKGSPLMVEGRLKYDEWEKDGQKHNRLSVVAERVQLLGGGSRGDESRAPQEAAGARADEVPGDSAPPAPEAGDDDNLPF